MVECHEATDGFSFFGVEVEALKIGDSDPAPFFRVIAKPNSWARAVKDTVKGDGELADRHKVRIAYWNSFATYLKNHDPTFSIRKQNKDHWHEFKIGRSGFAIGATINTQKQRAGVELYLYNNSLKAAIRKLEEQKSAIEAEFGEPLEWQELPSKKASRIVLYRHKTDPANKDGYSELHAWMLDKMQRFRKAFAARVKVLDLGAVEAPDLNDAHSNENERQSTSFS